MKRLLLTFAALIVFIILFSGSVYGTRKVVPFNLGEVIEKVAHHREWMETKLSLMARAIGFLSMVKEKIEVMRMVLA